MGKIWRKNDFFKAIFNGQKDPQVKQKKNSLIDQLFFPLKTALKKIF